MTQICYQIPICRAAVNWRGYCINMGLILLLLAILIFMNAIWLARWGYQTMSPAVGGLILQTHSGPAQHWVRMPSSSLPVVAKLVAVPRYPPAPIRVILSYWLL